MMDITTQYICRFDELIRFITASDDPFFYNKEKSSYFSLWYRGHGNHVYHLIPTLYRHFLKEKISLNLLRKKERLLLEEFAVKNYARYPYKLPENTCLWMSIMQHYGVSTRLLDWSDNLLTAMFFALEAYFKNPNDSSTKIPCLWILDPLKLNDVFRKHHLLHRELCIKIKQNYIPSTFLLDENAIQHIKHPVALISPPNNDRIAAQSGTFTLFPLNNTSLEESGLDQYPESDTFLRKVILLKPKRLSDELKLMGIRRSMFYPEMANTSPEIEEYILRR